MNLSLNSLCCEIKKLAAQIEDKSVVPNALGSGTAYTVTATPAPVDMGTDPVITLPEAGTYLILATAQVEYVGATVTTQTLSLKLRRTNNTPADLGPVRLIDLPVSTTLTHTYGVVPLAPVLVTAKAGDALTVFANLNAALGAGTITVSASNIFALRIA
jgi:hypothetical protein